MQRLIDYSAHHPWLAAFAVLAALAVVVYEVWHRASNFAALAPDEAVRMLNQGATVLDLRASEAYSQGHISGARHFDAAQLGQAAQTLKRYKERPLILCCERGTTAGSAARQLTRLGFKKVFNLRGGIAAWRAAHLPLARG